MPRAWLLWFLCTSLLGVVDLSGAVDTSVCTPGTDVDGTRGTTGRQPPGGPKIPATYHVVIELKDNVNKNTVLTEEFKDGDNVDNQRGVISEVDGGTATLMYYFYKTNEAIVAFSDQSCLVTPLAGNTDLNWVFGYNNGKMSTTSQAWAISGGDIVAYYKGADNVRGIRVDHWYSCQWWPAQNATLKVHWYFGVGSWMNAYANADYPTPVRMTVVGTAVNANNEKRQVDHTYDFFGYELTILESIKTFEIPNGIVCMYRKNRQDLPVLPDAFSLIVESTDRTNRIITYARERFDTALKIFQYSYRNPFYSTTLDEIHDIKAGVSYVIDRSTGQCNQSAISPIAIDIRVLDNHGIRMRTAMEFLELDKANYTYNGRHMVRGLSTMQWVAYRYDFPAGFPNPGLSVWRWYFLTDGNSDTAKPIPIRAEVDIKGLPAYQYDIFQWNPIEPGTFDHDMSPCYKFENRALFSFLLPQTALTLWTIAPTKFRIAVLLALWDKTAINPLRFANYQTQRTADDQVQIMVELSQLVGTPSDIYNNTKLEDLTRTLTQLVDTGTLPVTVPTLDNLMTVYPITGSARVLSYQQGAPDNYEKPTTYGAGAMAGIALGMIVLGCLGGAGGAFLFFK